MYRGTNQGVSHRPRGTEHVRADTHLRTALSAVTAS